MQISFVPLTADLVPACRAFNQRLRGHAPFPLPEKAPPPEATGPGGISWGHYVALDQEGEVRGGVLLMEQRGWLRGSEIRLVNPQSPLSEGIIDRQYAGVALAMLHFLAERSPYQYAVGMGSETNPYARMLKAAGFTLSRTPFYFSVIRPGRFLREIGPLRRGPRRIAAQIASRLGIGAVAAGLWNLAHRPAMPRGYTLEAVASWPEAVDAIWERLRGGIAFATVRDRAALGDLYPQSQPRLLRWLLRYRGEEVGWSAGLLTPMEHNGYFGNLRVGTILDGLAPPEHLEALIALSRRALADLGAELVLTNQTLPEWPERLRGLGFLAASSNYLLAISRPISAALKEAGGPAARIHVNRGDGEGRLNL
jgi:hypothetical protein